MTIIQAKSENDLTLGRQGENLARQVVFDLSAWEAEYGPGVAELIHQRPGDASPYPVAAVREGSTLVWTLTATDTAVASSYGSDGHCELRYYVGEVLVKSRTWLTKVIRAMSAPSETAPPDPEQGWVDQVLAAGAAAKASADAAKADADRAAALVAEVSKKAAQTAKDAVQSAQAKEAAQTAQRLAEEAQSAAEAARTAAAAAQAAAETAATDAAGAKQGAETAQKAAQDAAAAAAKALADIRALYQEMQTWAQGVIQDVNAAGSAAVQSVQSAGDAQIQRVAEEGTRQTSNAKAQADAAALSASGAAQSAQQAAESAAVYDTVAADVTKLKQDLVNKVDAIEMSACELIEIPASSNLCDMAKIKQNTDTNPTTGTEGSNTAYCIYYVDVKPGMNLYVYVWDGATAYADKFRFVSAFNEDGTINPDKKQTVEQSYYVVPDGIYRVCLMMYQRNINENKKYIITTEENIPTEYEEYREAEKHYVAKDSFFDNVDVLTKGSIQDGYMEKVPYNMLNPEEVVWNKFINAAGTISDNSSYYVTGYISVDEGDLIRVFTRDLSPVNMRTVCAFDSGKIAINNKGSNAEIASYTVPNGIKYIRISLNYNTNWTYYLPSDRMVTFAKSDVRFMNYGIEDANKHRFRSEFAPAESANLHVYLPPEIDVGIGRTVELYNELVCLEANKYHMQWKGTNGVQYANKYSIYGRTAGQSSLTLNIFNDSMGLVWTGTTTVVVSANSISSTTNIIPIGDSLTNMKPWLSEVQNLSGGKIKWIGTRHKSDQPESPYHEGRSGYSAGAYLTDSSYTFDSNYAGSPSVSGTANPFWDGTKFSLAHYVQTQGATIGIPDAVMLLLGTNDIAMDATDNVANIKAIVTSIRSEYESMPIFVCNTIYRSNQNGYYSAGSDNYTSASDWAFGADMKIMNLQNALSAALAGMENVYIVPLSVCMDREHNFGQVDAAVNPRLTSVTIKIPNESVHPQESGYLQMADVMYSSFVVHLS